MRSRGVCADSNRKRINLAVLGVALLLAGAHSTLHAQWSTVGPEGGDARVFAAVPGQTGHLFLGTTNSWIYESTDEGASWHRLSKLDASDDLVVDHIIVDPSNPSLVYAAAWKFSRPDGGLWVSHDGGKKWDLVGGLKGQSVRTFVQSLSDPKVFLAGTLEGVFRSNDSGASWNLISPAGSREIHEIESLAVDPKDPNIVYAGTWHLPWKTSDGGKNWENIKQGIIEDSDVFSIIVDPSQPNIVYASACSGIYKSENAGSLFHKIQGIPATARRTRVLRQDPVHPDVVYAGTTEGLYKTTDAGKTFKRMTGPDVIVNDVFVDPRNPDQVLLATDRSGVLFSKDAAFSFVPANQGFSARKVEALLIDPTNPSQIYAGVVNDKTYGGVFVSSDGGVQWKQVAEGLDGRDVFSLARAADGTVWAGTNSGIFALKPGATTWTPQNKIENVTVKKVSVIRHGKRVSEDKKIKEPVRELTSRVSSLDLSADAWVAATATGLYTSTDKGESWQGGPVLGQGDFRSVTAHGALVAAVRSDSMALSTDAGQTWSSIAVPSELKRIHRIAFTSDETLWLAASEGVFYSHDQGKTWQQLSRLPLSGIDDLYYDAAQNRILVSSRGSDFVYAIDAKNLDWKWHQTGFHLFLIRSAGSRLVAASIDDGILVEPAVAGAQAGQK